MANKAILVHGWGGNSSEGWFPWLKKELEARGFEVASPDMPNTKNPKIQEWVECLSKITKNPDNHTYFVGHSMGCQAIMRYIQQLPKNIKVGGAVFVAGFFHLTNELWDEDYTREIAAPWLQTPLYFDKLKSHCSNFTAIMSDNDPYVPLSDFNIFKKELNAKIIIERNKGHFHDIQLPSALNSITEISKT